MEKKHQANLALFKSLTGKSVISVPKMKEPVSQGWKSNVREYWK